MTAETKQLFFARGQYELILNEKGVPYTEQSGFLRVEGAKGNRLYVASTKTVRRIDISGFETDRDLAKSPHTGPFGNVKQQMRLDGDEGEVLFRFAELVDRLLAQPAKQPAEKAPKAPKEKKAKGERKGWGATPKAPPPDDEAQKAARIALIKKVAAEKGMAISPKSIAQAAE